MLFEVYSRTPMTTAGAARALSKTYLARFAGNSDAFMSLQGGPKVF